MIARITLTSREQDKQTGNDQGDTYVVLLCTVVVVHRPYIPSWHPAVAARGNIGKGCQGKTKKKKRKDRNDDVAIRGIFFLGCRSEAARRVHSSKTSKHVHIYVSTLPLPFSLLVRNTLVPGQRALPFQRITFRLWQMGVTISKADFWAGDSVLHPLVVGSQSIHPSSSSSRVPDSRHFHCWAKAC